MSRGWKSGNYRVTKFTTPLFRCGLRVSLPVRFPAAPPEQGLFVFTPMNILYTQIIKKRVPEANIQAEFYLLCRRHGIRILLEVKYENCRFDALVFNGERPFAIIEVKSRGPKRAIYGLNQNGRQMQKYSRYGLPIIGVVSPRHIISAFNKLLTLLNERPEAEQYQLLSQ